MGDLGRAAGANGRWRQGGQRRGARRGDVEGQGGVRWRVTRQGHGQESRVTWVWAGMWDDGMIRVGVWGEGRGLRGNGLCRLW